MQLNYRKTVVDLIDEAIAKAPRAVESITLTKAERAEFYRHCGDRFRRLNSLDASVRGRFLIETGIATGRWIDIKAAGE
jgi:hypothetical protein